VSRNDASTSLWLLKFVLVLFQIFYLVVIILVHIGANIVSLSGQCISWVTELRYLGIILTCSRIFHAQLIQLRKTSDINIVRTCQHMFGFEIPSVLLARRTRKFLEKMKNL